VPAELVFDQGLGDLFVVRVAGNVIAPSLVGSVEFAVEQFGTRLVVVMGHSSCGAVKVTLDVLESGDGSASPNLADIVDRIRSAIEPVYRRRSGMTADELMARAVRENVESSVRQLKAASESLARLSAEEDLLIVGAEYSLETGEVDFFSGLPDADPA
jgi:carbonic anhydrase